MWWVYWPRHLSEEYHFELTWVDNSRASQIVFRRTNQEYPHNFKTWTTLFNGKDCFTFIWFLFNKLTESEVAGALKFMFSSRRRAWRPPVQDILRYSMVRVVEGGFPAFLDFSNYKEQIKKLSASVITNNCKKWEKSWGTTCSLTIIIPDLGASLWSKDTNISNLSFLLQTSKNWSSGVYQLNLDVNRKMLFKLQ